MLAILPLVYCALFACCPVDAADDVKTGKPTVTMENLQSWMLPPEGWKVDFEVLDQYFWLKKPALGFRPEDVWVSPFLGVEIDLGIEKGHVTRHDIGDFYINGSPLDQALKSKDDATRTAAQVWLRQSIVLYYAGFHLAHRTGRTTYAPWITPVQEKQINSVVDEYLAQLKPLKVKTDEYGVSKEIPCSDETLFELITTLKDKSHATVLDFYGEDFTLFVYPVYWVWNKEEDSDDRWVYRPWTNDNVSENYMADLIGGTLPQNEDNKIRLWCRDVYLSYLAGKQLLEKKSCPIKDGSKSAFLEAAIQEWWRGARMLQKKR